MLRNRHRSVPLRTLADRLGWEDEIVGTRVTRAALLRYHPKTVGKACSMRKGLAAA